jgi:hypothetical protein
MNNVTFGERVAAYFLGLSMLSIVILTALGHAVPEELRLSFVAAVTYVLGSRTSTPKVTDA